MATLAMPLQNRRNIFSKSDTRHACHLAKKRSSGTTEEERGQPRQFSHNPCVLNRFHTAAQFTLIFWAASA
jgi:hypothetical protein